MNKLPNKMWGNVPTAMALKLEKEFLKLEIKNCKGSILVHVYQSSHKIISNKLK